MVSDGQIGTAPLDATSLDLILTPHGHLLLTESKDAPALDRAPAGRLRLAFASGPGGGLLQLGAGEVQTPLPLTFGYWRDFSARYVTALCAHPEAAGAAPSAAAPGPLPCPDEADLDGIVAAAPPSGARG